MIEFDPVCLKSKENGSILLSIWRTRCKGEITNSEIFILPPVYPKFLIIKFKFYINDLPSSYDFLYNIKCCFENGKLFWEEQLSYTFNIAIDSNEITLKLGCKIWTAEKIATLIEQPSELLVYNNNSLTSKIDFVPQVEITVNFIHESILELELHSFVNQINEYLASLFISQLEFRYPLVFSTVARKRFQMVESQIGPISYSLTESSALFPNIIQCIIKDKTSLTSYQIIGKFKRKKTDKIRFDILLENTPSEKDVAK
ncbi:hypothetical protein TBLA_0E01210 [Henningerozyma blattae CBS 6284]|uniref:Uncharacterized protein n=1 Tax=Henningerozyma blattae (strain ATCC 34711 / CBS 6284 / DSM 70876 / NBRC 10599 / NRRL Y-10934 / UCD 77-7) TaxID=1071380 RepID=I2H479_HENB6|nr:hypothetical protein TBLA_0E01210 [Tetrapisispora blattae CBS 6284]CCH61181.1 hypothetical protein TBLA_0E01210 [Tetrapisispora blattae CBS 6284]